MNVGELRRLIANVDDDVVIFAEVEGEGLAEGFASPIPVDGLDVRPADFAGGVPSLLLRLERSD